MIKINSQKDKLYNGLPCIWDGTKYILFSPYSFKLARLSSEDIDNSDIDAELERFDFFGNPSSEIDALESIKLTLITTTDCNLRCKYCYVNAGGDNKKYMSPQLAIHAIKGIMNHKPAAKEIHVTFFGGEPTLNMEVIEEVVRFVQSTHLKYKFHISTNGIFSDGILGYLLNHNFDLTISLDGTPDINDKYRIFPNGGGSSKKVEGTIKELVERKLHFNVRMTIINWNVKNIPRAIDYFFSLGVKYAHLELLNVAGRASRNGLRQPSHDLFLKYFKRGIDEAERRGIFIINSTLMNMLTPSTYFCLSARGGMYVITPDGKISLCFEIQDDSEQYAAFVVGSVANNRLNIDQEKVKRMSSLGTDSYEDCASCFAKHICSGGCPLRNSIMTGNIHGVPPSLCKLRREIVHEGILRLYKASKNARVSPVLGTSVYENLRKEC